jgi:hypothetical protein
MATAKYYCRVAAFFLMPILMSSPHTSTVALAQEPSEAERKQDLHDIAKGTSEVIEAIRPALFGWLTGHDLKVYREITVFRVSELDDLSRSEASWEEGQRAVIVDVGYQREIYNLAQAYMIEQLANKEVVIPYINYVVESWHNHTFVKVPSQFANFNFDKVLDDPNESAQFAKMNTSALAFILAHEVGHHILGHMDKPWPTELSKMRELETGADNWAFKCLRQANPHFSPLGGLLPLIFGYYISPSPLAAESKADHPADLRRIHSMFQVMLDSLPDYRDEIEKSGQAMGITYDNFKKWVEQRLQDYEKQMETDSPPVRPSDSSSGPFARPGHQITPAQPMRVGAYCGNPYGGRYCALLVSAPLGAACGCTGIPGSGVVVP